jgi:hypothetical protein
LNFEFIVLDHYDVTWDGFKGGSSGDQEEEQKKKQGVFFVLEKRIRRVENTCGKKPQILF